MKKAIITGVLASLIMLMSLPQMAMAQNDSIGKQVKWQSSGAGYRHPEMNAVRLFSLNTEIIISGYGKATITRGDRRKIKTIVQKPPGYNKNRDISPKDSILQVIADLGFFELKDAYGAPEGVEAKITEVKMTWKKQTKTVIYRENPDYEAAPPAFMQIVKMIEEFAAREPVY